MPTGVYVRKKNRKQTEETKRKIGDKRRGKKHSEGSRKKMSGRTISQNIKDKISATMKLKADKHPILERWSFK